MAIPKEIKEKFTSFCDAVVHDHVTLIECTDNETGDPVYVMAITVQREDKSYVSYPVAILPEEQEEIMAFISPPEGAEELPAEGGD